MTNQHNKTSRTFCKKLTASSLRAAIQAYQQGNPHAAERLRQAFAPLVCKLSRRHSVYSVLGEDAEKFFKSGNVKTVRKEGNKTVKKAAVKKQAARKSARKR